ncbi:MAG: shikimate kinase [Candidatus Diapherotrites archaeon CG11_big_fil_rev_8_21_14_0_20_37_9]|nr:MAG: shikimate kinase [Candidatus Diapherotrites archaeon CG11_big_fil_rev_8_21_14_0_20_37_9]
MNIALIGYRATGKTTIGKKLAKRMNMKFLDTDKIIEKKIGKKIKDFFDEHGEKEFREIESTVLKEICLGDEQCISCGGGIVILPENRDLLKKKCVVVLLESTPQAIYMRTKKDSKRPALTSFDKFDEIVNVLEERKDKYESIANVRADTSSISIEKVVQVIIDKLVEGGYI